MKKYVIGINGSFHDASVCVLSTEASEPILLLAEDRHSGISHHFGFPFQALSIAVNKFGAENISAVGYSRDKGCFRSPPQSYFAALFDQETDKWLRGEISSIFDQVDVSFPHVSFLPDKIEALIKKLPNTGNISVVRKQICYLLVRYINELKTEENIIRFLPNVPMTGFRHHDTHAATYFASSFDEAAIITWDGRGEFDSTVLAHGKGNTLQRIAAVQHPLSIGTFYEVFAEYIGLGRVEGPGKLMGLAAYGDDRYVSIIDPLIEVSKNGFDFSFNDDFLTYSQSERLSFKERLKKLIGPGRKRNEPIEEQHSAIAYAVQKLIERVCGQLVCNACKILDTQNVVFSGGLSLNCVMNEKLRANLNVEPFLIPPCGDDGTALGAALLLRQKALEDQQKGGAGNRLRYRNSYGTKNDPLQIRTFLDEQGFQYAGATPSLAAALLADGKVLGCILGRYEFGPRALGFRSILADPRPYKNWPRVNNTIKYREDFRPFAPVMLKDEAEKFWGSESTTTDSPYMLLAPKMSDLARETLGAVIHRDLTARVQTLEQNFNEPLYDILCEFKKLTGVGVLMNTSLNMSGESIISNFVDLLRFMAVSEMDAVLLEDVIVERSGNEECLATLVSDLPDRQTYLNRRPQAYQQEWGQLIDAGRYRDFFEFYQFLYNEEVS